MADDRRACPTCNGKGTVTSNWRTLQILDVHEITGPCSTCRGTGRAPASRATQDTGEAGR